MEHQALVRTIKESGDAKAKEMKRGREDLISVLKGINDEQHMDVTDVRIKLQEAIEKTDTRISVFEGKVTELEVEKHSIGKSNSCLRLFKRRKIIKESMKLKKSLIKHYQRTLGLHIQELEKVNGDAKSESCSDDSSSDDSDCSLAPLNVN